MRDRKKELEELSPEALEEAKKQRSINRVFGLVMIVVGLLSAMLIYEIVLLFI